MRDRPISEYGLGEFPPLGPTIHTAKQPTPREVALDKAAWEIETVRSTDMVSKPNRYKKAVDLATLYLAQAEALR